MKRRLLIFTLYISTLIVGFLFIQFSQVRATYSGICNLIEGRYYEDNERFRTWINHCHMFALSIDPFRDHAQVLVEFQNLMDRLGSSHFKIYDLEQDQRMWQGMSADTGLHVTNTAAGVLVIRVNPGSPGESAGIRAGDLIVKLNGKAEFSLEEINETSGNYQVKRGNRILTLPLKIARYQVDGPPTLKPLKAGVGLLDISSFRAEFFEKEAWLKKVMDFRSYQRLVVDLRQNSGGNFVSMLRALSPFLCGVKTIGKLSLPREEDKVDQETLSFPDSLLDETQLVELNKSPSIDLKTFNDYGPCFRGPVDILISEYTSSVAEIFVYALHAQREARLWGRATAGEVVLAVWYPLPQLGAQYTISIPRSLFTGSNGEVLEGVGLKPDVELDDESIWRSAFDLKDSFQQDRGIWNR